MIMFFSKGNMADTDKTNTTYLFEYEKNYDQAAFQKYMMEHRYDCMIYAAVYLVVVFGAKTYMNKRQKFDLRPYLATWSGILAIFSIIGAIRTVPEMFFALSNHGFEYSCCVPSYIDDGTVTSFWVYLFVWSKVLELGDTVFIVLRKQPLIFLHWYHHVTVLCYAWMSFPMRIATGRWFMVMNYVVHSFMYSYYALRAMRYRFPKWVNMFITSLQLIQMMIGITVNVVSYRALGAGRECASYHENIRYSLLMYLSYLVLFSHFFYTTYLAKPVHHKKSE